MPWTPRTSPFTDAQWVVSQCGALAQEGRKWNSPFIVTNIAGAGDTDFLLLNDVNVASFSYNVESDKEALVYVYENPTITANGAALPIILLNRNNPSGLTTDVETYSGATIAAVGDFRDSHILGDAAGGGKTGGDESSGTCAWVVEPGSNWLLRVTTVGANTRIDLNFRWCENI